MPAELVLGAKLYLPQLRGVRPPGGVRIHIAGIDLIRDPDGHLPRARGQPAHALGRLLRGGEPPHLQARPPRKSLDRARVRRVDHYPTRLAETLRSVARPRTPDDAARRGPHAGPLQLGLLRAQLPGAHDGRRAGRRRRTCSSTATGSSCARRAARAASTSSTAASTTPSSIPRSSGPTACSACPGLMRAWAAGNVALANAPGNGVADDKAVYAVRARHDPLLPRRGAASSSRCRPTSAPATTTARYVLEHLPSWSSRPSTRPAATACSWARRSTRRRAGRVPRAHPRRAAPLHRPAPRRALHLPDLGRQRRVLVPAAGRPPALTSSRAATARGCCPGGLTRVALREGSLRRQLEPGRRLQGHLGAEGGRVISRVADHCFWLGRYLERAESTARVLRVTAQPGARRASCRRRSAGCPWSSSRGEEEHFVERHGAGGARRRRSVVQRYMTWDEENPASLQRSVGAARENARSHPRGGEPRGLGDDQRALPLDGSRRGARRVRARTATRFYRRIRASTQLASGAAPQHDAPRRRRSTSSGWA